MKKLLIALTIGLAACGKEEPANQNPHLAAEPNNFITPTKTLETIALEERQAFCKNNTAFVLTHTFSQNCNDADKTAAGPTIVMVDLWSDTYLYEFDVWFEPISKSTYSGCIITGKSKADSFRHGEIEIRWTLNMPKPTITLTRGRVCTITSVGFADVKETP